MEVERREETNNEEISSWRKWDWKKAWWWQPDQKDVLVQGFKRMKLDGVKEAMKPDIHISKRVLWLAIFALLLSYGGYLSKESADEYFMHSVHYTRHGPILVAEFPFGAVTICPQYLFNKNKLNEAEEMLSETIHGETVLMNEQQWMHDEVKKLLSFIYHFCQAGRSFFSRSGVKMDEIDVDLGPDMRDYSPIKDDEHDPLMKDKIIPFFKEGQIDCSNLLLACFWNGKKLDNCNELFIAVQTDVGMCCSFNKVPDTVLRRSGGVRTLLQNSANTNEEENMAWENWHIDTDPLIFPTQAQIAYDDNSVPKRQKLAGRENGLSLVVLSKKKPGVCPLADAGGLMVAVHNPMEEPAMLKHGFFVRQQHETFIKITSKLVKASSTIKNMHVDERKCYFNNDAHNLQDFTKYTEVNCQSECQAHVINAACNCIPLALSGGNRTLICGPDKEDCVLDAKSRLMVQGYEKACVKFKMKCYPECNKLSYDEVVSTSPYNEYVEGKVRQFHNISADKDFTTIHVFQKQDRIDTEEGQQTYDMADFVGLIGGILGLTSGVTLMSIFNLMEGLFYIVCFYLLRIQWWKKWFEAAFGPYVTTKGNKVEHNIEIVNEIEDNDTNPTDNSLEIVNDNNEIEHDTSPIPPPTIAEKKSRLEKFRNVFRMRKNASFNPSQRTESNTTIATILDTPTPPTLFEDEKDDEPSNDVVDCVFVQDGDDDFSAHLELVMIPGPSRSQKPEQSQGPSTPILTSSDSSSSDSDDSDQTVVGRRTYEKACRIKKALKPWTILTRKKPENVVTIDAQLQDTSEPVEMLEISQNEPELDQVIVEPRSQQTEPIFSPLDSLQELLYVPPMVPSRIIQFPAPIQVVEALNFSSSSESESDEDDNDDDAKNDEPKSFENV